MVTSSQAERKPLYSAVYRVYWSETDAAQMMHFSNFFRVCERAEEEFMHSLGVWNAMREKRIVIPRVHAECDYEYPLRPGDRYRVDIDEVVVGRKSLEYRCSFHNLEAGRLSARCRIVVAAVSIDTGRAVEVPTEIREALLKAGARVKAASSHQHQC